MVVGTQHVSWPNTLTIWTSRACAVHIDSACNASKDNQLFIVTVFVVVLEPKLERVEWIETRGQLRSCYGGVGLPAIRGQQSDAERGDGCFDAGIAEDEGIWASMLRNN